MRINCPNCSVTLDLDQGFAGATCRCTTCDALIAVPRDPEKQVPAVIRGPRRPSRPGSPVPGGSGVRSGSSMGSGGFANEGSSVSDLLVGQPTLPSDLAFRGRSSRQSTLMPVFLVAAGGAALVVAVTFATVAAVMMARGPEPAQARVTPERPEVAAYEAPAYQPPQASRPAPQPRVQTPPPAPAPTPRPTVAASPAAGEPALLGMRLQSAHTAIVLDAVEQSRGWLAPTKPLIAEGLSASGANRQVSFFYVQNNAARAFSGNPAQTGPALRNPLTSFLGGIRPASRAGFWPGIQAAIDSGADEIVFITSRTKNWGSVVPHLEQRLDGAGRRIRMSFIQMDGHVTELEALARRWGGQYVQADVGG